MSTLRVDTIQFNQAGNATISVANSHNVSISVDGTEKLKLAKEGINFQGPISVNNTLIFDGSGGLVGQSNQGFSQQIFTFEPITGTFTRANGIGTATYTQSGSFEAQFTKNGHGFLPNTPIYVTTVSTGTLSPGDYVVISATTNTFNVNTRISRTTSGTVANITPPIIITANNDVANLLSIGLSNTTGNVFISFNPDSSSTIIGGSGSANGFKTIYRVTSNTFMCSTGYNSFGPISGLSTQSTSGVIIIDNVDKTNGILSKTWTKPDGCKKIEVIVVGGGGGESQAPGGGYSSEVIDVSSISSVNVTVGFAGSQGGGSGGPLVGGTSSFGSYLSATGGNSSTPGIGVNGDINFRGWIGQTVSTQVYGGYTPLSSPGMSLSATFGRLPSGFGAGSTVSASGCDSYYIKGTGGVVIVKEYY